MSVEGNCSGGGKAIYRVVVGKQGRVCREEGWLVFPVLLGGGKGRGKMNRHS